MTAKFRTHLLQNGLQLLGEINPANVSSAVGFFVKTGARDETTPESGVSHFLEHMMFKGTPTRSALDINLQLGSLGAQANAFTSEENTVYYSAVIPEKFSEMQELLSDMLRPALDEGEFSTEKNVILEEIALYQDRPHFYLFEQAFQDYFTGHTAGNSVLGSHGSITALSCSQMKEYFNRRYSPSNIVLVASGNFNWEKFVEDAERQCGSWVNFETGRTTPPFAGKPTQKVFTKKNLSHSHAVRIAPGCSAQEPLRYAMSLLSVIMGDSSGSRMYWELVDKGIADAAYCDSDERDGTGTFMVYVSTEPERLDEVLEIATKIVAAPKDFSDADLERAKSKIISKVVLDGELPMGRLMSLGMEWNYRRETTPLSETISRIRSVTREDIHTALEKYPLTDWAEYRLLPE
jgi:predicted Zn-dependent peptidase